MTPIHIVDAVATDRSAIAAAVVFEYIAMTEGECHRPVPASVDDLPPVLSAECRDLQRAYAPPGVVLLACVADEVVGCVGLKHLPELDSMELTRLYVRDPYRGQGIGRMLVRAAHAHAARTQVRYVLLDVMPERATAIAFYRRAGYDDTEPYHKLKYPMVVLRREVRATDLADGARNAGRAGAVGA